MCSENSKQHGAVGIAGFVVAWIMVLAQACTSTQWQADRIDRNLDRMTQEDVLQVFGLPHATRSDSGGRSAWVYRYSYATIGGTAVVGKTHCWENVLWFDETGMLRKRDKHPCPSSSPS